MWRASYNIVAVLSATIPESRILRHSWAAPPLRCLDQPIPAYGDLWAVEWKFCGKLDSPTFPWTMSGRISMTAFKPPDMSPDEFREWGRRFVDWIADYLEHPDRLTVFSQAQPGNIRKRLPPSPPIQPESMERVLQDLNDTIVPGLTHWNHPRFFGYFPVTGSGPGILGELLSAAFNVNGMWWGQAPA